MQKNTTAPSSEAGRAVASNRRYTRDLPPISAETAAADVDQLFPEKVGKAPMEQLPDPPAFTRPAARRPIERPREPLLQWATGLTTKDRQIYAGWLVEVGKDFDLDAAMEQAKIGRVTIKHGSGNLVTHWALETASLFIVCDGVQSIAEMASTQERFGIAFGWRRTEDGRQQSVLRCRVLIQELCAVGYCQPLLLSLKSTLTGDFLSALIKHYETLDSINPIRKASGKPEIAVPFYAVSIALGAGAEVARGSGGQTREIAPMVEVGPRDKAYIASHWCKRPWVEAIEGLADETILWSRAQSVKIASGEESREEWE
jgi:hypothetical protein